MQLSTEIMSGLLSVVGGLVLLGILVTRVFVTRKVARQRQLYFSREKIKYKKVWKAGETRIRKELQESPNKPLTQALNEKLTSVLEA